MNKMLKECMKPHSLLHTLGGVGLGLLLVSFIPAVMDKSLILGVIFVVVSVVGEFTMMKK